MTLRRKLHEWLLLTLACIVIVAISGSNSASSQPADGRLMLTPLILSKNISEALCKSKVVGIPQANSQMYSGYITVDGKLGNHVHFLLFLSKVNASAPLVVWLNGGPGTTSMMGAFVQNGPFKLSKDKKSYTQRADSETIVGPYSALYIDTLVGAGFSYSDSGEKGLRTSSAEIGNDLFVFFSQFLEMFPQFKESDEVYLGGQIYAAKYIMTLAEKLLSSSHNVKINLRGVYLEGPLLDPETQFTDTADYAHSLGVISDYRRKEIKREQAAIFSSLTNGLTNPNETIFDIVKSAYNFTMPGPADNIIAKQAFRYDQTRYLGEMPGLRTALHVGNQKFIGITNFPILNAMLGDMRTSVKSSLEAVLDNKRKVKVLIFNGMHDMLTNTPGLEGMLWSTRWQYQNAYKNQILSPWLNGSVVLGYHSQTDNLCRFVVNHIGCNISFLKPLVFREMMRRFINKGCI